MRATPQKQVLTKELVEKVLKESEKEMKKKAQAKHKRLASIGKISSNLKDKLNRRLSTRLDRKQLTARFILREDSKAKQLFGSMSGRKGTLAKFLTRRPKKTDLMSLNIISEEKEGVCAAEHVSLEAKRKAKRKDNLALLLNKRPSMAALRQKKIIIDPDAINTKNAKAKLESFLKIRPKQTDSKVRAALSDRKTTKSAILSARGVLGGFLAKRSKPEFLLEKKILNSASHIGVKQKLLGATATFVNISTPFKVASVSCGWAHTVVVDTAGKVFSFGLGQNGRLGVGDTENRFAPTEIKALSAAGPVRSAVCGDNHSAAVLANGDVYTWGMGSWGRLGTGAQRDAATPKRVEVVDENKARVQFASVACGGYHTLLCGKDGGVFAFGWNRKGQIGNLKTGNLTVSRPVRLAAFDKAGVKIVSVCCGTVTSGALSADGNVFVWGGGSSGLGLGDKQDVLEPAQIPMEFKAKQLVARGSHFLALTVDNNVISWGSNTFGELGRVTDDEPRSRAQSQDAKASGTKDRASSTSSISSDRAGATSSLRAGVVSQVSDGAVLACGVNYSAFVDKGTLYTFGKGLKGTLGSGERRNVATPQTVDAGGKLTSVACGYAHTIALTDQNALVGCGVKDFGRLGVDN